MNVLEKWARLGQLNIKFDYVGLGTWKPVSDVQPFARTDFAAN